MSLCVELCAGKLELENKGDACLADIIAQPEALSVR
jgi:hypothetical protein